MRLELAAALLAIGLAASPAAAETAVERLFAPGALEAVANGTVMDFTRARSVPEGADLDAIMAAPVKIAVGQGGATVRFDNDGRPQSFTQPLGAAHPVLLLFLETSHKSVAELSGGSPFYIKNRIVESFHAAETEPVTTPQGEGQRILLKPFAADPNRPRMGAFADLEIVFVLIDGVPGGLYSAAATAGAYKESMTWSGESG